MKQIFGGAFVALVFGWLLYSFAASEPCERVYRGAAPVRIGFDGARWVTQNFLSQSARIRMIYWSVVADNSTQKFIGRLFYGPTLTCGK